MKQHSVMKNIIAAAMLMLMAMLVGCFGGGPSNAEIEKVVKADMSNELSEKLRSVINFNVIENKKTDDSHYTVKVSYDLQFKLSFDDVRSQVMAEVRQAPTADKLNAALFVTSLKDTYGGDFKKDDLYHQEIEVIFAKTDKGWKMAATD